MWDISKQVGVFHQVLQSLKNKITQDNYLESDFAVVAALTEVLVMVVVR